MDEALLVRAKKHTNQQLVSKMDAIDANHFFVDDSDRDTYFIDNSEELVPGILISSGDAYQMYNGTDWVNKTPVSGVSRMEFDEVRTGLVDSLTWDGTGDISPEITVTGASLGDFVLVSAPVDLQGLSVNGYVSAPGKVRIRVLNETGVSIDLGDVDWKVKVIKS